MALNITATEIRQREEEARIRERAIWERLSEPIVDALYKLARKQMSEKKKSVYIAGPMSQYPEFNFPAFFAAQKLFEDKGYEVFNPAAKDGEKAVEADASFTNGDDQKLMEGGWDFREAFDWDCNKVIYADAIYMLKGWEKSSGARAEHAVAVSIQQRYPDYKIIYE